MRHIPLILLTLGLLAGCSQQSRLQKHLARAEKAYSGAEWEVARIEYLNVARLDPRDPVALSRLGLLYARDGEIPEALHFLNRARQVQPSNIVVRSKLSLMLAEAGQLSNALAEAEFVLKQSPTDLDSLMATAVSVTSTNQVHSVLERLLGFAPSQENNPSYHRALAQLYQKADDFVAAEATFKKAEEIDPDDPRVALGLAHLYWLQSRNAEADQAFQRAVAMAPIKSNYRLRYADFLIKTGRLNVARELLQQTIREAPDFSAGLAVLAEISLQERDFEACARYLNDILKREPNHRDALLVQARLRLMQGDAQLALPDLEKLTSLYPRDDVAFYHLGLAHQAAHDSGKALVALDRAILLNPNFIEAILLRSEMLIGKGDAQLAIPALMQLTRKHSRLASAQYLLASAYRLRGSPEEALRIYAIVSAEFPEDPQPLYLSGLLLRQQGLTAQAREFYEKCLQVMPNYALAVDQIIELDIENGDYENAVARVQTYLEKYPGKPMPYLLLAKVYEAREDLVNAEAALEKCLECDPNFLFAHRALAQLFIASGRHSEAISKLEIITAKDKRETGSLLQLGMLYESQKRFQEARMAYERLLAVNPRSVPALNNLAYLLAEYFDETSAALALAQKARDLAPFEPHSSETFGWITYKQGNYSWALAVLHQAAEKLPGQPEVLYHLGMAYYMNGDEHQARRTLELSLQFAADFNGKSRALRALQILNIDPANPSEHNRKFLDQAIADDPNDLFANVRLAQFAEGEQNWDAALQHYDAARRINPKAQGVLMAMAAIHIEHRNSAVEGLPYARRAWTLSQDPKTAAEVGRLAALAGEYVWAAPILEFALNENPVREELPYYLGLSYFSLARFSDAYTVLQQLLQANHSFSERPQAELLLNLSLMQLGIGDLSTLQALRLSPVLSNKAFPSALFGQAFLKEHDGDLEFAQQQYEKIMESAPEFLPAQRQLVILLVQQSGNDHAARRILEQLRSHLPEDPALNKLSGQLAFRQQDYRQALAYLREAVVRYPRDSDLLFQLGLSQFHLKDQRAKETLALALRLEASSPLAQEAQEAINQLP